jgi:hypothetical protein
MATTIFASTAGRSRSKLIGMAALYFKFTPHR